MNTLSLDTTGPWCSAALVNRSQILFEKSERLGRGHAERLAPMVQEVLSGANLSPADIQRIVVCTGPGSFTGLRVALAFARSFALPRKIPVIGVSALHAFAVQGDPDQSKKIVSLLNVKRGEICWAGYDKGTEIIPPTTLPIEELKTVINNFGYDVLVGDAAGLIGANSDGPDHVIGPVLGWLGQDLSPQDFPPDPVYSRGPDAKLPGGKSP